MSPSSLQTVEFSTPYINDHGQLVRQETRAAQMGRESPLPGLQIEMVLIPTGRFLMGSPAGQGYADERPQHPVAVEAFWLGRTPVTQAQWERVMGAVPSRFQGKDRPVDNISWEDARAFCQKIAFASGLPYRLPTEAEWEYACRAGGRTPFCYGETLTTQLANYNGEFTYRSEPAGEYRHETTAVGTFPPNAFGLCDMHGNLWEWCADRWHPNYAGAPYATGPWSQGDEQAFRVTRGGSWHDTPEVCRSAVRLKMKAGEGEEILGMRLARSIQDGEL